MAETPDKKVIRDTDADALALARNLISTARHGALAVNGKDGVPSVSRVQTSTDIDGALVTLVSGLSPHTGAMIDDPRCAILVGETGKGDPLAHPRITVALKAERIERGTEIHDRLRRRHLARHPKAALYVDFGDFTFFRLVPQGASLNGGFGRAYNLTADNLAIRGDHDGMAALEEGAVEHMNTDHGDAVSLYAETLAGEKPGKWRVATMDAEGFEIVDGDRVARVSFPAPLENAMDLRKALKELADAARAKRNET